MKKLWISLIVLFSCIIFTPELSFSQEKKFRTTNVGNYEVSLQTNPESPRLGEKTFLSLEVLTNPTKQAQPHVDYEIVILKNDEMIFTSLPQHTHTGLASVSHTFDSPGEYVIGIYIDGINFSPIPTEIAAFQLEIRDSEQTKMEMEKDVTATQVVIPDWIKQVAQFWVSEQIDDEGFVQVIEYLVNQEIISIPYSDVHQEESVVEIPDWVKTNAEYWVNDGISDDDFAVGLEWLINNGIIKV